jgi:hypothetical protein
MMSLVRVTFLMAMLFFSAETSIAYAIVLDIHNNKVVGFLEYLGDVDW